MEFNIELGSPEQTGVVLSVCSINPEIYNNAIITEKVINEAQIVFDCIVAHLDEFLENNTKKFFVIRKQIEIEPHIEISVFANFYVDIFDKSLGIEDDFLYKYIYHTLAAFCSELKLMLGEELKNK